MQMVNESTTPGPEGRKTPRVRTYMGGRAIFNNGNSSIDCQVRNLSAEGAKLTLSESVGLPSAFLLDIPSRNKGYRVEVRWRTTDSVGVEFVDRAPETREPGANGSETIDALRAENATLRRRVRELVSRLADLGHSERPE
jgi:hypothetical protein